MNLFSNRGAAWKFILAAALFLLLCRYCGYQGKRIYPTFERLREDPVLHDGSDYWLRGVPVRIDGERGAEAADGNVWVPLRFEGTPPPIALPGGDALTLTGRFVAEPAPHVVVERYRIERNFIRKRRLMYAVSFLCLAAWLGMARRTFRIRWPKPWVETRDDA